MVVAVVVVVHSGMEVRRFPVWPLLYRCAGGAYGRNGPNFRPGVSATFAGQRLGVLAHPRGAGGCQPILGSSGHWGNLILERRSKIGSGTGGLVLVLA